MTQLDLLARDSRVQELVSELIALNHALPCVCTYTGCAKGHQEAREKLSELATLVGILPARETTEVPS